MTTYGVTGHQRAPRAAWALLSASLPDLFKEDDALVGITSLAAGSDQRFAEAVIDHGGSIIVITPAVGYEDTFNTDDERLSYQQLLGQARKVECMPYQEPSEAAYLAAGMRIVDLCEVLVAVWDGMPAKGKGGTADIVEYARATGKPVKVIWPQGLKR